MGRYYIYLQVHTYLRYNILMCSYYIYLCVYTYLRYKKVQKWNKLTEIERKLIINELLDQCRAELQKEIWKSTEYRMMNQKTKLMRMMQLLMSWIVVELLTCVCYLLILFICIFIFIFILFTYMYINICMLLFMCVSYHLYTLIYVCYHLYVYKYVYVTIYMCIIPFICIFICMLLIYLINYMYHK